MEHDHERKVQWDGAARAGAIELGNRPPGMIEVLSLHAEALVSISHRMERITDRVFGPLTEEGINAKCGLEEAPSLANQVRKIDVQISRIHCLLERLEEAL